MSAYSLGYNLPYWHYPSFKHSENMIIREVIMSIMVPTKMGF